MANNNIKTDLYCCLFNNTKLTEACSSATSNDFNQVPEQETLRLLFLPSLRPSASNPGQALSVQILRDLSSFVSPVITFHPLCLVAVITFQPISHLQFTNIPLLLIFQNYKSECITLPSNTVPFPIIYKIKLMLSRLAVCLPFQAHLLSFPSFHHSLHHVNIPPPLTPSSSPTSSDLSSDLISLVIFSTYSIKIQFANYLSDGASPDTLPKLPHTAHTHVCALSPSIYNAP